MFIDSFHKEILPGFHLEPPLAQLEAMSSCAITGCLGQQADPHLAPTSLQAVVEWE